jgi:hypothetical protein
VPSVNPGVLALLHLLGYMGKSGAGWQRHVVLVAESLTHGMDIPDVGLEELVRFAFPVSFVFTVSWQRRGSRYTLPVAFAMC